MFSDLIVLYLFLGGTGAGALVLLSTIEIMRTCLPRRTNDKSLWLFELQRMPQQFMACAWSITWACMTIAILCLTVDLGRPDRMLAFLTNPELTAMTVGAYSLATSFLCSGFFALHRLLDTMPSLPRARTVVAAVGMLSGLATALYTGLLLEGSASVLVWQSPMLPLLFLLSSLSCGMAILLGVLALSRSRRPVEQQAGLLATIDSVLIVAETVVLVVFLLDGFALNGAGRSVQALVGGDLCGMFWAGLVIIGLAVPFIVERFIPAHNFRPQLLWVCACLLLGGFMLRWLVVAAAEFDITQSPDMLYGLLGSML